MTLPANSSLVTTIGAYQIYENVSYNVAAGLNTPAYGTALYSVNEITGATTLIGTTQSDGVSLLGSVNGYSVLNANTGYGEFSAGSDTVLLTNGGQAQTAIAVSAATNVVDFATANSRLFVMATPPYTSSPVNNIYALSGPSATPLTNATPLLSLQGDTTLFATVENELVISNILPGTAATNYQTDMQLWLSDGTTAHTSIRALVTFNGSVVQNLGIAGGSLFVENIYDVGTTSYTDVYQIDTLTNLAHKLWSYANTIGIPAFPMAVAVGGSPATVAAGSTVALSGFSTFFFGAGSVTFGVSVQSVDGTVTSKFAEGTITGAGTSHMTIVGTATQVNDVLAGLEFTGTTAGSGSVVVNPTAMPAGTTIGSSGAIDITVTNAGTAVIGISAASAASVAGETGVATIAVSDSASDIVVSLGDLQSVAAQGKLASIALTDAGVPSLQITSSQATIDAAALDAITGYFSVVQTASGSNLTITGVANALGNTVVFNGAASQFSITAAGDGVHFTVATSGSTDHLSGIQALKFNDYTLIVAPAPGTGTVTAGNIAELYSAVLAREPDVTGLSYYEKVLQGNPTTPMTTLALDFLNSPEYSGNAAHKYAQSLAGDAQFITDTYSNLLHRAPEAGAVTWYQTNVIAPFLAGLTAGTSAYAAAELNAHAEVLVYFSSSAEFLSNVQVTATHPADQNHWLLVI